MARARKSRLDYEPLTPDTWADFETLFGERGACGGCWCMWWRQTQKQFDARKGPANKRAMRRLVDAGHVPGLLAYEDGRPVGWCSVAPRETFSRLGRSRILEPVDDQPVWSVVCFFVDRRHRATGLSAGLLEAAADHVHRQGGRLLEGYPVEPRQDKMPDLFAYTGLASAFRRAGFQEVARRSATRPIMRRRLAAR